MYIFICKGKRTAEFIWNPIFFCILWMHCSNLNAKANVTFVIVWKVSTYIKSDGEYVYVLRFKFECCWDIVREEGVKLKTEKLCEILHQHLCVNYKFRYLRILPRHMFLKYCEFRISDQLLHFSIINYFRWAYIN